MGAELFHADGQTDMPKRTVAFRNFANAPKNDRTDAQCECMDCITLTQDTVQLQVCFLCVSGPADPIKPDEKLQTIQTIQTIRYRTVNLCIYRMIWE